MSTVTLSLHQGVRHIGHHDVERLQRRLRRHIEKNTPGIGRARGRLAKPDWVSLTTLGCERLVISVRDGNRVVNIRFNATHRCWFDAKGRKIQLAVEGHLNEMAYLDMQPGSMALTISERLHKELFPQAVTSNATIAV